MSEQRRPLTILEQWRLRSLKKESIAGAPAGTLEEQKHPNKEVVATQAEEALRTDPRYTRFFEHIPSDRFPRVNDIGFVEQALDALNKE